MKLCSIASGSSGNCIYLSSNKTNLLIDVGISCKKIENSLKYINVNLNDIDAILITHEHLDHISGLGSVSRKYNIPIYSTIKTINEIMKNRYIGQVNKTLFNIIQPDKEILIKEIKVKPFSVSHDAVDPVCYTFDIGGHKVGIATDLGFYDNYIISNLANSEILFLEANHDVSMVEVCRYPYLVKERILGDKGHLSNENSGRLICELFHKNLKYVFLGHLSSENNFPDLAYETVNYEISNKLKLKSKDFNFKISVARRSELSELVTI